MTNSAPSADDLLASILATFGKKPKGAPSPKPAKKPATILPFPLAYAEEKTGYRIWEAKARVVLLEEQVCSCCGTKTTAVKDELFLLENALSKSAWYRHEGYGIIEPDNLPIRFQQLPPRPVTACAVCASAAIDDAINLLLTPQLSLPL